MNEIEHRVRVHYDLEKEDIKKSTKKEETK